MENSTRSDASNIYRMIMVHDMASKTPAYEQYLRDEAKKDLYVNTEAKMAALKDLAAKQFAPKTSINHPRLWILRMRDDAALQNLGTPSIPRSDHKGKTVPR
ncbi:hypothetical protein PGT21_021641 [Puccinia graminis f. sp. tritici]|uniref:Uncharacterized protein n=2 Tax=Puccinia graminis f. sp. tritici TaxID=56615 RepID=E3K7P5_PUCGT|nr:uncharacterized protein PGTG_06299 [Puccinia graminis f. sp. tritici CRL 75-36-700-3]EFP80343.1 hypothetical protein PGTG_06299 [Puccinia graminis f. sp. tritici CRL 75-36-700-3]KAA1066110.1 hypothetical protein PGT21_021641 [Puccinia graminis f. sp. tritici]KAA1111446.1 hypothetical protein PGTUg99_009762 [Puccinia graminis f. sp. tritici]